MLKLATMDEWWDLTRAFPAFRVVGPGPLLKDYGHMAVMRHLDEVGSQRILEFGHGFRPVMLQHFQDRCETWGIDDYQGLHYMPPREAWERRYAEDVAAPCGRVCLVRGLLGAASSEVLPEGSFDAVCSVSVLEEVPIAQVVAILRHIHRLLRPGGIAINTHDLILGDRARLAAYVRAHASSGLRLDVDESLLRVDRNQVLIENPAWAMIRYQGGEREDQRRYRGHWTTVLSVATRPG